MKQYLKKQEPIQAITFDELVKAEELEKIKNPTYEAGYFSFENNEVTTVNSTTFVIVIDGVHYSLTPDSILYIKTVHGVRVLIDTMRIDMFEKLYEPIQEKPSDLPFTEKTTREILAFNMFRNYGPTERTFFTQSLKGIIEKQFPDFDENGLRFPIEHLNKIGLAVIALPIFLMTNYVDLVTKTNIDENNQDFIDNCISEFHLLKDFSDVNATSIGNLGYIYKNCQDDHLKQLAKLTLLEILDYYLEHHFTEKQ